MNLYSALNRLLVCCASVGALALTLHPQAASSAEKVYIVYGPLNLSLSIDSLEKFAQTGKVEGDLRFYKRFTGDRAIAQLREVLQIEGNLPPTVVSQLTYAPIATEFLTRMGNHVRTEAGTNGFHAIRAAWIISASRSPKYTLIDILRNYPTTGVRIDVADLQKVKQILLTFINYKNAATQAIAQAALAEAATAPKIAPQFDLSQPGTSPVTQHTLQLQRPMRTLRGGQIIRQFQVDLYIPERTSQPAPVIAISHGMGATPIGFGYLARHLASHGFAVAIPEHIGSGAMIRQALFAGLINTNVYPTDFIERPSDIKQTLDELERLSQSDPALKGRFNTQNVGMIGHSFGGYTALAIAGARLNTPRISQDCAAERSRPNLSIYLQCLSQQLPPTNSNLGDPRIKAVISLNPLTSVVFGPEGLGAIQIPTMLVSASNDILTEPVAEQIHPFLWLKTPEKYLALMKPAGHTAADQGHTGKDRVDPLTARDVLFGGLAPTLTREYIRTLSLAFMHTYIGKRPEYRQYLSAGYAQAISREPIQLDLVRSLTPTQLEQAYGEAPPLAIFPTPVR